MKEHWNHPNPPLKHQAAGIIHLANQLSPAPPNMSCIHATFGEIVNLHAKKEMEKNIESILWNDELDDICNQFVPDVSALAQRNLAQYNPNDVFNILSDASGYGWGAAVTLVERSQAD